MAKGKERREDQKFMAALKGIDLDDKNDGHQEDKVEAMKRKVNAKLTGTDEKVLEFRDFGIEIETEE